MPEGLAEHGVEVTNFRPVRLDVPPVRPDRQGAGKPRPYWRSHRAAETHRGAGQMRVRSAPEPDRG